MIKMVKCFCVQCNRITRIKNGRFVKLANGRKGIKGNCNKCDMLLFRIEDVINIGGHKNIFLKSVWNATAGLPISFVLNISILPFFALWFGSGIPHIVVGASLLVAIPFWCASVARMHIIDIVYEKYNVKIDPKSLFIRYVLKR